MVSLLPVPLLTAQQPPAAVRRCSSPLSSISHVLFVTEHLEPSSRTLESELWILFAHARLMRLVLPDGGCHGVVHSGKVSEMAVERMC